MLSAALIEAQFITHAFHMHCYNYYVALTKKPAGCMHPVITNPLPVQ